MVMGVASAFKDAEKDTQIVAFEPANSAVISTGQVGKHTVEGIGVGMVPPCLTEVWLARFDL